ncbi:MAG: VOC family protein [Acidimicrobiales bacterium]|jgi:uncharacterized glyoxalase superfamily protein PhnB
MSSDPATTYVWPSLAARNARALIDFYVEAFGFTISALYGEEDHVDHCEILWPLGGGIMLGDEKTDRVEWALQPGTFGVYVVTDNPDVLHDRALAAGATLLRGLNDTDYGSREFSVQDPEGNRWSFGTYRGAEHSHPH